MKRGMSGQKTPRSAGHRVPPRSVGKSMATLHGAVGGSQWIQWRGSGGASKLTTRFGGWKPNSYHRFGHANISNMGLLDSLNEG